MSRLRRGLWKSSGSWRIMLQDVQDGLSLSLHWRKLLGKVPDSVAKLANLPDGRVKKAHFVDIFHLSEVEPKIPFMGHKLRHRLPEGPRLS